MRKRVLESLENLKRLRDSVPTYVFFGGIGPMSLIKVRKDFLEPIEAVEVDVILHSPGGSASDAYRLIRTFREKFEIVNVIVPFWAKSAATLFAFGASRIVLHGSGEFGPIDAQIKKDDESDPEGGWASALNVQSSLLQIEERSRQGMVEMFFKLRTGKEHSEIQKIGRRQLAEMLLEYSANFYKPLLEKIEPIEMGVMARTLNIGRMYAKRILKQFTEASDENVNDLLDFLVYECPDHGYVVDYPVLKAYLPHLIKSDDEPFGDSYKQELETLSISLMEADATGVMMVGFLEEFTSRDEPATLESDIPYDVRTTKSERKDDIGRGSSDKSDQNGDKKISSNGAIVS